MHIRQLQTLRLLLRCVHRGHQSSDAVLELAVLGGIDERIDTEVGEHQHGRDVIVPTTEVGGDAVETDDNDDVI